MTFRYSIPDFELARPLYVGAAISFWTVDANGVKTSTLATLYAAPTGTTTLANPHTLDGEGKFAAPVYTNTPVIAEISGRNVEAHSTGVIATRGIWRGSWVTATVYYTTDLVKDGSNAKVYIVADDHTAGASVAADVSAGHLVLVFDPTALAYSGAVQGDLFYGSAPNTVTPLAKNTTATRYLSNTGTSNNPAWAAVDLTNGVTGVLPGANGGTGVANTGKSITIGGSFTLSGAFTTTLTVTANTTLTLPTSGTLATRAGTETLTNKSMSGSANTFTNIPGTAIRMGSDAQGDILYFNGTNYVRLGAGTAGYNLKTNGAAANPSWTAAAFRAHKDGVNQTALTTGAYNKITAGTETFDVGGYYNTGTSRWTPPAGVVKIEANIWVIQHAASVTSPVFVAAIAKNGVNIDNAVGTANVGLAGFAILSIVITEVANGTDYYELFAFVTSDTPANDVVVDGTNGHTHWSGALI